MCQSFYIHSIIKRKVKDLFLIQLCYFILGCIVGHDKTGKLEEDCDLAIRGQEFRQFKQNGMDLRPSQRRIPRRLLDAV